MLLCLIASDCFFFFIDIVHLITSSVSLALLDTSGKRTNIPYRKHSFFPSFVTSDS